ncbi:CDC45-related protein [Operophtera brumata]|uniref:CDC45-related protein n=1 Tax=Operophtera brumata TaxID=104452 RepID=A0A0L7LM67_OPEBR|nr:CDC45-related protein [Operophtera brumata]
MFVEDLRNDFYNLLLGNRVLLLVHLDVDAICTCRILQGLFKSDNISYTLVPVGGIAELKTAYEENNQEIKYVVLINCGGTIDLVDILQPEEDVVFFVLDAHKPTDVCNVYSDGQNEETESGREGLEALSACVALDLAWRVSRCGPACVWAACVASAAQSALCLRAPAQCLLDTDALATHHITSHSGASSSVILEKDLSLPLYREWSVEAALRHAPTLAPQLHTHSRAGEHRIRTLLADTGIPLQQARQAYRSMDVELRRCLLAALEDAAPRHKLPSPVHTTFLLRRPHSPTVAALDLVYAIMGLIEHVRTAPWTRSCGAACWRRWRTRRRATSCPPSCTPRSCCGARTHPPWPRSTSSSRSWAS